MSGNSEVYSNTKNTAIIHQISINECLKAIFVATKLLPSNFPICNKIGGFQGVQHQPMSFQHLQHSINIIQRNSYNYA